MVRGSKGPAAGGEKLTNTFARVCVAAGLPMPVPEYRFHPVRKWRWDYCWLDARPPLALEVDGGLYVAGRHSRGAGRERDLEKIAEGMLLGWRVLTVSPRQLNNGQALRWLEALLREEVQGE